MPETSAERIERLRKRKAYFESVAAWCATQRPTLVEFFLRRAIDVQQLIDELSPSSTQSPEEQSCCKDS